MAVALGKTLSSILTKNPYSKEIPALGLYNQEKSEAELEPIIKDLPELEEPEETNFKQIDKAIPLTNHPKKIEEQLLFIITSKYSSNTTLKITEKIINNLQYKYKEKIQVLDYLNEIIKTKRESSNCFVF